VIGRLGCVPPPDRHLLSQVAGPVAGTAPRRPEFPCFCVPRPSWTFPAWSTWTSRTATNGSCHGDKCRPCALS
jgi:hypothetical protein